MSKKTGAIAFLQKLKERAKAGDKLAMAELQKLRAIGAQYRNMAESVASDAAAEELVDGEEDVVGDDEENIIGGDKLEQADFIAQKYNNADGLVQKVALRNHGWAGLNDVAKFARINPPSVMQGTLGGYQIVNSTDIKPIQVANWGGEDEETVPITVTFAPVEQLALGISGIGAACPAPFGVVRFGTRAALVEARVDIGKGAQFTVSGSYCTLEVGIESFDFPAFVTSMKLAGMLSFYPCVRTTPVTRTVPVNNVIDGALSAVIPVPAFAKNVIFLDSGSGTASYRIVFVSASGQNVYVRNITAPAEMTTSFPLSDDIVSVRVQPTGAGISTGRFVFELSL